MFGFPIGNGNVGFDDFLEKFTNNADSGFPKIQQREVFYSVKDGVWTDATIWQTASGRVGKTPTQHDDIYIRHAISSNTNASCNNMFVSGFASISPNTATGITVNNIKCYGTIGGGGGITIVGNDNFINRNLYAGNGLTYAGGNQEILNINYNVLVLSGSGRKYITNNLIVGNGFIVNSGVTLDLFGYDVTINGSTQYNGNINATGNGNHTYTGNVSFSNTTINFVGNPNMEFRSGGISFTTGAYTNNLGTGNITFTTSNQTITSATNGLFFNNPIFVANGITLTFPSNTITTLNNIIDGLGATSRVVNSGNSNLAFGTQNAAENSMVSGIFDITTNANTISYNGNYSATIPSRFPTFHNLTISGTGTKSLGVNTTINNNLNTTGTIDFATYDITINGTSTIPNNPGKIMKSGSGNVTFIGLLTIGTQGNNGGTLDFSGGNPNVEFRNGYTGDYSNAVTFKTGTGTWRFTTNNQRMGRLSGGGIWNYDCPILIENIVLSVQADIVTPNATHVFKNSVNGTTAGSSLINYSTIEFQGPTTFMTTGTFDFITNQNFVIYNTSTSFVVPYGSYWGLYLRGVGSKTLSQNTTCFGNFEASGTPVDFTTYNVDIYGTTLVGYTTLRKSGAGNITFRGLVNTQPEAIFNFSGGNPNVEFRGGITLIYNGSVNSGTGTWSFTTSNQTIQINGISNNYQFNCTISIVNINLTMNSNNRTFTFTNPINGTTGTSQLTIAATSTINYQSSTQPMITGILDTSTNLNTWIYGSGNQDIKGNTYRNLTLNGGGTKTLQGNVSVQNTYTLTAPATVNLNGFTLTNP